MRQISEENFRRIQRNAVAFEDTLDTALSRIIDFYEAHVSESTDRPSQRQAPPSSADEWTAPCEHSCDPFQPPNLTHTKVTFATIGKQSLDAPNWNSMLDEMVRLAIARVENFRTLKGLALVNIFEGKKVDDGYHYLADIGISVQGQSANDAWRWIAHIARSLGVRVQVQFSWRNKEGAAYPGEGGRFVIAGHD
ncbi:MAG: hypothetical protein KGJ81_06805 [Alphaproteobacteria bacterium]|nr:hypothetical protein [Alphaproteobacteria bacterium]